jgi:hypothetical protein
MLQYWAQVPQSQQGRKLSTKDGHFKPVKEDPSAWSP